MPSPSLNISDILLVGMAGAGIFSIANGIVTIVMDIIYSKINEKSVKKAGKKRGRPKGSKTKKATSITD